MHQFKTKNHIILASVITMILSFYLKVYAEFPSNVMFTNARGTKFTVSWTTENIEIGKVKLGKTLDDYSNWIDFNDDRGSVIDDIHHVTISNIIPLTNYYFEIISGGTIDNNGGLFYSINPGPALSPLGGSCQPAGMVYKDKKKVCWLLIQ
ncbi:MAG: hypothetical protein OMM_07365 [Candidatus Magnetoglobus multicellularis str. Araruama]|uniref:Purple acid phosphatase N-terminal domain-containing protein n=1 Tax=Candidatus Magnetoglobus multicellularis str. Araruama TaxID=890399 RepID=A0A1V1PD43_9BACT|nr:MAG: hypothetical protein OMM_07365 [Candidatus Magnetoglobus multicellularis str. Araruama]